MKFSESVRYLESLPTPEKWSLETPARLASLAGVHLDFEIIHVAGTNGKGSVCAYLASMLSAAGYRTGLYTSPHLERYNERIKISGAEISNRDFARAISLIRPFIERMRTEGRCPSVFEALTVAAFAYFSEKKIDFLVLETGMGGRLDATNIAPSRVQVITSLSPDHMASLGSSLAKIASEKAGIIKPNSLVVCPECSPQAAAPIAEKARNSASRLFALGKDFDFKAIRIGEHGSAFNYSGLSAHFQKVFTPLPGVHQLENAALSIAAIECVRTLGYKVSAKAIADGIASTIWPGRLELISKRPRILLDGAHNLDGVRKLKAALKGIFLKPGRKLILVVGIMADKDYPGIMRELAPLASEIVLTAAAIERSASPKALALSIPRDIEAKISVIGDLKEAVEYAKKAAGPGDLICITGSLFVVGQARGYLLGRPKKAYG